MSHGITISQRELSEYADLQRKIALMEEQLETLEHRILPLLLNNFPVEKGRYDAQAVKRFGRSVPWKQLVERELGPEAAAAYKKQFPVHVYYELSVVEHAVRPLWKDLEGEAGEIA